VVVLEVEEIHKHSVVLAAAEMVQQILQQELPELLTLAAEAAAAEFPATAELAAQA
jgi:hypothetical protein